MGRLNLMGSMEVPLDISYLIVRLLTQVVFWPSAATLVKIFESLCGNGDGVSFAS